MARRRWPTVLEACGQVARRQLVSEVAQKEQDVPARLVRERSKDSLGVGCRGPSHANERLAFAVIISKIQNNILAPRPLPSGGARELAARRLFTCSPTRASSTSDDVRVGGLIQT